MARTRSLVTSRSLRRTCWPGSRIENSVTSARPARRRNRRWLWRVTGPRPCGAPGNCGCWRLAACGSRRSHRIQVIRGHLPGRDDGLMDPAPAPYLIRINGHLCATQLSAFPALVPQNDGVHTVLTGLLDRPALYGMLAEIEALGLDLLEFRELTPGPRITRIRSPPLTVTAATVGRAARRHPRRAEWRVPGHGPARAIAGRSARVSYRCCGISRRTCRDVRSRLSCRRR
jgi:hypothetical protein